MRSGCRGAVPIHFLALFVWVGGVAAEPLPPDLRDSAALAVGLGAQQVGLRQDGLLGRLLAAPGAERRKRQTVDLSPLAEAAIRCVRGWGVPLVEQRNAKGSPVAVSARFSPAEDMPALNLHIGGGGPEPFGAFFPREKGFRLSITYPVRRFTLRVEAGEDSEFGNVAIAGLQWVHPNQRFAVGFGMPVRMSNSDGAIGAVLQVRLKLK